MYTNEGLVDLGLAERVDIDGIGAVEKMLDSPSQFMTTYWICAKDHRGLWVRAPRLYLVRPLSAVQPGGVFARWLGQQRMPQETVRLHS